MADLVVGRCADPARHVLYRVRRTPRGVEVVLSTRATPAARATLGRVARAALHRAGRSTRERRPERRKWAVMPWPDFVAARSPVGVTCRCQALVEVDPRDVAADVDAAEAEGRTRTVRVPFW